MRMLDSNLDELTKWLNIRESSLKRAREPYEQLWKDIREIYEPALGKHLIGEDIDTWQEGAKREDEKIFNSTPRIKLHRLAAGLQSGITNQATSWFKFASKDRKAEFSARVREYLDKGTEYIQGVLARSNVYPTLDQIYLRLGAFGQACAILVPDEDAEVRLILCDEGSYYIAENSRGRVDTCLRTMRMTLAQCADEFGADSLPDWASKRLADGNDEELITCYNLIYPASDGPDISKDNLNEFASIYWTTGASNHAVKHNQYSKHILDIRGYSYNPIIAPRWSVRGTTSYGCGPGQIGLPDAKELQVLELAKLRLVELESNPSLLVPASMRGQAINSGPGGIVFYNDVLGQQGKQAINRLFETRASIEAVQVVITECEHRLSQIFYTDLLAMMLNQDITPRQMTAREVNERASERVSLLGPVLTRLNNDLLQPLISGVWRLCIQRAESNEAQLGYDYSGLLDFPTGSEEPKIEFVSKLHVEQQASDRLIGLYRLQEFATGLAQVDPSVIRKLDAAKMLDEAARSLNEHGAVRDQAEYEQMMQAEAQMQQQQLAMQQQQVDAQTVRDLAGAKLTDGETALELLAADKGGLG